MNPTACYQSVVLAIRSHDYEKARNYALILQHWLTSGGDYPEGRRQLAILEVLSRVLRPACGATAMRSPFTGLICTDCNTGRHIRSLPQAIDEDWTVIETEHDRGSVSHSGLCPECRIDRDCDLL